MIVTEKYIEKFLRTNGIQDEYHVIHFCRELKINHYFKLLIFGMLTCCCDLRILIQSQFSITNFDTIFFESSVGVFNYSLFNRCLNKKEKKKYL